MKIQFATNETLEISYDSLSEINLDKFNLHRAILEGVDMSNSSFCYTDFRGAFLSKSNLYNCNLSFANLITAHLMYANLENSDMTGCRAMSCNFEFANLKNAILDRVNVNGADFSNCQLQGAKMRCIDIEYATFIGCLYDESTVWPFNFNPESIGAVKVN